MLDNFILSRLKYPCQSVRACLSREKGNILVYVVIVMVIFGLLGALMVSLFSTSIGSSATPNDARRAFYLSESGTRYAQSELWASDFSKSRISELNSNSSCQDNLLHFNVSPTEKFCINIFSLWFEAAANYNSSAGTIAVSIPEGQIPDGFLGTIPAGNPDLFLVNYNYLGLSNPPKPLATAMSQISAIIPGTGTSFQFTLSDDFVASRHEKLSLAVSPFAGNQTIPSTQSYLDLKPAAKNIFPAGGGAFEVQKRNFFYRKREDLDNGNRIRLSGISPVQGGSSIDITVASDDPVILSPRNRLIISEGKSGDVTFGKGLVYATAIADTSIANPDSLTPDWQSQEEAVLGDVWHTNKYAPGNPFFTADNTSKSLIMSGDNGFGVTWFNKLLSIGGTTVCNAGQVCQFGYGIRAFFILSYLSPSGDGDGLTFSLINGENNTIGSVGGDVDLSELLAYAGDSRKVSSPSADSDFEDGSGQGLRFPKMAIEFDGKTNSINPICDPSPNDFCASPSSLNINKSTRHDPPSDSVQYVFWGRSSLLGFVPDACCRFNLDSPLPTNRTYDDNRHDNSGNPANRTDYLNGNIIDPLNLHTDNWLREGPWAVRIEISRDPFTTVSFNKHPYRLTTWMKKCSTVACPEAQQFFRNTRFEYDWLTVPNALTRADVEIDTSFFNSFIFGFTSATSVFQEATISQLQWSFIRPNDPKGSDP